MEPEPADPRGAPITSVGIPTRERLTSLERCLLSLLKAAPRREPSPALVVVDDSRQAETRRANRELLQSLKARHPGPIFYVGPEVRSRYVEVLFRQAGFDPAAVRFGLLNEENYPVATGASRNILLLHTVGEACLQLDDDTHCLLAPAPDARPGLVFSSQHDPTEFWFPGPDEPLPADSFQPHDLLLVHEQLLGKTPGDCLAELPGGAGPDLDQASAAFQRILAAGAGRVRITAAGVAGDSGMSSAAYLLLQEGAARARLLRSEAVYRQALSQRQVLRAVTRPTVCDAAVCMAVNLGLDHRQFLPPFMPVQRNQDGIFGSLVKTCCPGTYFGFLPWMLLHQSPGRGPGTPADLGEGVTGVRSDHVVQLLIRMFAPRAAGPDARTNLRCLGQAFVDLASSAERFAEGLRLVVGNLRSGLAAQFEAQVQKFGGQPAWWADDVRRLVRGLHEPLAGDSSWVPVDLSKAFGPDAAGRWQRLVGGFGQFLQCWPDLVEAAGDLRARNMRPGELL
jgi:hypothetical protein